MQDVATVNDMPAPYLRDLRGDDLIHELVLLMDRLLPGDTLRIHRRFLLEAGASLEHVLPPTYPHERWSEPETADLCIKRMG
ncbi:MAG: hypothetical protein EBR82_68360 [Caulobacteraceae bacterium]|nr:hypothetical protein [Caulobacteraceae bacterium]